MMDANRDYNSPKGDAKLENFIQNAGLVYHYHEKFPGPVRTYVHGSKQLYYIYVDPGLIGTTERIGWLPLFLFYFKTVLIILKFRTPVGCS